MSAAVSIEAIDPDQVSRLRSMGEGHFFDRKSSRVKPSTLSKTVSAFANSDGGTLVLGMEDDGHWAGLADVENANPVLKMLYDIVPDDPGCHITALESDEEDGLLLQIEVHKSRQIVRATDGIPRIRLGAQNLRVDTEEKLGVLKRNKGLTSHETQTLDAALDIVANSSEVISFMLAVVPTGEPEPWLRMQQLIRHDKPTVGCVLLFADLPQALIPKASIKLYRYATTDGIGSRDTMIGDPFTIEGPLYPLILEAVERTASLVSGIQTLGSQGLVEVSYPPETLHEIITNAVLHRDYAIQDDVHIRVFDNRVEVESPGTLPAHVTVENILEERFARNSSVVRLISKYPDAPNKDVGEGLRTAFDAMTKLRLHPPEVTQRQNSVLVNIRHHPLASPEEMVFEYVDANAQITNSEARDLTGIASENRMKEVFYRLRDRGLLERVPGLKGNKSAWRKPVPPETPPAMAPSQQELDL